MLFLKLSFALGLLGTDLGFMRRDLGWRRFLPSPGMPAPYTGTVPVILKPPAGMVV